MVGSLGRIVFLVVVKDVDFVEGVFSFVDCPLRQGQTPNSFNQARKDGSGE